MSIRFEGTLTRTDERITRTFPFDVPEGTTDLNVRLRYDPAHTEGASLPQQISMTVYGPNGWVSEINRAGDRFEEGTDIGPNPSPWTFPTRIAPGRWTVFLSTYRIVDTIVQFEIEVTFRNGSSDIVLPEAPAATEPRARGAGWYRGDLHAHTVHSDGAWGNSDLVDYMQRHGLDFCTLTDHNTVTGLPEHLSLAHDGMVTVGGSEVSTYRGHMLALGVHERIEWRNEDGTTIAVSRLADAIHDVGGLSIICHPRNPGDPWCCGCRWEHLDMMPGNAKGVEIWNGVWSDRNGEGIALWQSWLDEGHRLVATSGTDHHGRSEHFEAAREARAAVNVVYAQEFRADAILDALKRGHSYVSAAPTLQLHGTQENASSQLLMGDQVQHDGMVTIDAAWSDLPESASVHLVIDGQREVLGSEERGQHRRDIDATSFRWLTLEVWDDDGAWAISNPIYGRR